MLPLQNPFRLQRLLNLLFVEAFNRARIDADQRCSSHHIAKGKVRLTRTPLELGPLISSQPEIVVKERIEDLLFTFRNRRRQLLHIPHHSSDEGRVGRQILRLSG
ncbi:hypothetical protein D3C81_1922750 [compost metagenome]